MNYYEKYIKYKNKYIKIKKLFGGAKLKVGDKAKYKTTELIGIITKIYNENSLSTMKLKFGICFPLYVFKSSNIYFRSSGSA